MRDTDPIAATLESSGLRSDHDLALDATITRESLGRARSTSAPGPLPRIEIGRDFEVLSLLGEGGMGCVHLAVQRSLDREVAIKTTRDPHSATAAAALCSEAVVTGHLEHPGIVPVHQLAIGSDGSPVLVMKRVEGTSWAALLSDPRSPAWDTVRGGAEDRLSFHVEVLVRVCDALAFAHSRGVVHRDMKPENVMVGGFGEVYLVDWGIADRIGAETDGSLVGTPLYMAPEMAAGGPSDARTDVFLVGATLHEVLCGAPPHSGPTLYAVLAQAHEAAPPTYGPEIDPFLAAIAARAMRRDPAERFASALELGDALRAYARHRASRALSVRADEVRATLAERLDAGDLDDVSRLYALLAEARFGYDAAAREWPGNDAVRPGVRACDELAVDIELARRDAPAARAKLEALEEGAAAWRSRLEALERELANEAQEGARLRALAEVSDSSRGRRSRLIAGALAIAGLAAFSSVVAGLTGGRANISSTDVLGVGVAVLVGGLLFLVTFGRRLWAHPFNRRLAVWYVVAAVALVVDRVIGVLLDTPVSVMLTHELVLLGLASAAGAVFALRLLWVGVAACFGAAFAATVVPDAIQALFAGAGVIALATVPLSAWRARSVVT